jgi:hypothetical protein
MLFSAQLSMCFAVTALDLHAAVAKPWHSKHCLWARAQCNPNAALHIIAAGFGSSVYFRITEANCMLLSTALLYTLLHTATADTEECFFSFADA